MQVEVKISSEELEVMDKRVNAARNGPWISHIEHRDFSGGDSVITIGPEDMRDEDLYLSGGTIADQDFIAAARQDVPRLIAAVRALEKRIAELEKK